MRAVNFAKRNFKEIIRDPLSVIFAIALPLFLLFIFQQFNIPSDVYSIENFTPGIVIFSFAFITMFTATLVAKDRTTSLITRLCASPMGITDYILGYVIAVLPLVFIQNVLFFGAALLLGLKFGVNILLTILVSIPLSLLFIELGILLGCVTTDRSSAGVSSIIVQLVAFTSGMYFEADMMGGFFNTLCKLLPFSGCLDITKAVLNGTYEALTSSVLTVIIYTASITTLASILFKRKLESDTK
ncbi:MAG: ABC transporter permease [Ruminococcaceae bacterium]|nr:ABC transporter permease [Oscillospiraceae bacterium]